jgi:histidinol-phosphate aminotransferase
LRLGLLAGSESLLHWTRRVLSPYSVNSAGLVALTAALNDRSYLDGYVAEVLVARKDFLVRLNELGLKFWPTQANFVLVNIGASHRYFASAMREQGILVRDRSADPGCDGLVRITIGTREQMQQAAVAISQFLSSHVPALSS